MLVSQNGTEVTSIPETNHAVLSGLFTTITNANFDSDSISEQIMHTLSLRDSTAKADRQSTARGSSISRRDARGYAGKGSYHRRTGNRK